MTSRGLGIRKPKVRGEWAELRFMVRAAEEGLCVTKPWGDSARYDFAVEYGGEFLRVQVKSTMARFVKGGYVCTFVRSGMAPYKKEDVDFFAIYVIPEETWYVIPAEVATRHTHAILLNPQRKQQRYSRYLEAWHLLRIRQRAPAAAGDDAKPEACPNLRREANSCQGERLPRLTKDLSGCQGITKTGPSKTPSFTALGCHRLQRCIECFLVRACGG